MLRVDHIAHSVCVSRRAHQNFAIRCMSAQNPMYVEVQRESHRYRMASDPNIIRFGTSTYFFYEFPDIDSIIIGMIGMLLERQKSRAPQITDNGLVGCIESFGCKIQFPGMGTVYEVRRA